ncbi:TIM barrel protein [Microbacterium sp. ASV81]|uniref:TIM barrel protein n=1 Tax=Microbacterium capsulatum TaxID=3041921 RepID=A0ABU0XIS0_9MICO|nr:TIM barrel protein [Microbacterium sp. ASV81]MDQ4215036.1 TIM barrel protein [Microbacterium sp. ASV81]
MRIGADVTFSGGASRLADSPIAVLDALEELGFQGILVRTLDEAFPTLDSGDIAAFAREAAARGFLVQAGVGKINPYMTAELPRVRDLGDGSYLAGMQRMIRICGEHGWTEAWTATGGFKEGLPVPYCFDRFRTDATWADQLDATSRFLDKLAPTLRQAGVRLNIETHEEITTREILRLVAEHGDDVLGVCLDPANLPVRGEAFGPAVGRVAATTRITHLRDAVVTHSELGLSRFLAPIGEGAIDWDVLLGTLLTASPDVQLFIEGIGGSRAEMVLDPEDPDWRASDPDLDDAEIAELVRLADDHDARAARGDAPGLAALRAPGADPRAELRAFLGRSLTALQARLEARDARIEAKAS